MGSRALAGARGGGVIEQEARGQSPELGQHYGHPPLRCVCVCAMCVCVCVCVLCSPALFLCEFCVCVCVPVFVCLS